MGYQISNMYEVHQVGLKDSGSQNFRTLAFRGEAVGVTQILYYTGNGNGAVTDGKFYIAQIMFFTCHIWNMREVLVSCREK
jgi:hypothetical protein